ncbi:tauD, partial [Symbiodinium sp. CCMP2456]
LDLSSPDLPSGQLRALLWEHGLLLFRDQDLLEEDVLRVASAFAEPVPAAGQQRALATYRVCNRDPALRGQDFWHSDNSYAPESGGPTLLYALDVPVGPEGPLGDTLFADAGAPLTAELRGRVQGLRAGHNLAHNGGVPLPEMAAGGWQPAPDILHDVLRSHPFSGREIVFVNEAYVSRIEGLVEEESKQLLADLQEHVLQSTYRHRWRTDDLLVWDNHRLQHKATTISLPAGAERVMWRVQTRGPGKPAENNGGPTSGMMLLTPPKLIFGWCLRTVRDFRKSCRPKRH